MTYLLSAGAGTLLLVLGLAPWVQRPFLFELGLGQWPLFHRSREKKKVYLTFDDGPVQQNTLPILDTLEKTNTKATFFVVVKRAATQKDLVRRIRSQGHIVGCHGMSHSHLFFRSMKTLQREVAEATEEVEQILGERISFFRPPYGVRGPRLYRMLRNEGLRPVFWDVLAFDWWNPPPNALANRVIRSARPGSIVLLHDGQGPRPSTVSALPHILNGLRRRGLEPERL